MSRLSEGIDQVFGGGASEDIDNALGLDPLNLFGGEEEQKKTKVPSPAAWKKEADDIYGPMAEMYRDRMPGMFGEMDKLRRNMGDQPWLRSMRNDALAGTADRLARLGIKGGRAQEMIGQETDKWAQTIDRLEREGKKDQFKSLLAESGLLGRTGAQSAAGVMQPYASQYGAQASQAAADAARPEQGNDLLNLAVTVLPLLL